MIPATANPKDETEKDQEVTVYKDSNSMWDIRVKN